MVLILCKNVVFTETLEKRSVNHLFWNPNGQFIVLAGLRRSVS